MGYSCTQDASNTLGVIGHMISSIWAVSLQFDWEPISPLRQKEPHAGLP